MSARRPPYSITGGLKESVEAELQGLLERARRGELIGLAWVAVTERDQIEGGLAGNLGRDRHKAAGILHQAASATHR